MLSKDKLLKRELEYIKSMKGNTSLWWQGRFVLIFIVVLFTVLIFLFKFNYFGIESFSMVNNSKECVEYRVPLHWSEHRASGNYEINGTVSVGPKVCKKRAIRVDIVVYTELTNTKTMEESDASGLGEGMFSILYSSSLQNNVWNVYDEDNELITSDLCILPSEQRIIEDGTVISIIRKNYSEDSCTKFKIIGTYQCVVEDKYIDSEQAKFSWKLERDDEWHSVSLKKISN